MHGHIVGRVMFEIAVMAAVKRDDDRQHLTEAQLPLTNTAALAVREQALLILGLKPLAKVVNVAEHGNVTVQVVKTGITPQRTLSDGFREAKTEPLPPTERLYMRR